MKNVIDAVNTLKAEIPEHLVGVGLWTYHSNEGEFNSGFSFDGEFVCTFDQFNQCVKECSDNFGTSITYAEYKEIHNRYLKQINCRLQAKPAQITSPIYTKAMSDAGELPSVGVKCLWGGHNSNYVPSKILCIDDDQYFMIVDGVHKIIGNPTNFKPLTPPIELIDGERYHFVHKQYGGSLGFYNSADEKFYNWDMWVVAAHCTNIQLLEVKS